MASTSETQYGRYALHYAQKAGVPPAPMWPGDVSGPSIAHPNKNHIVVFYKPDCTQVVAREFQRSYNELDVYPCTDTQLTKQFVSCGTANKNAPGFWQSPLALFGISYPLEMEISAQWANFTRHGSDHQMCSGTTTGVVLCDRFGGAREKLRKWVFDRRGDEQGGYGYIHVSRGDEPSRGGPLHQPYEYAYFWSDALPALPVDPIVYDEWLLE